MKIILPNESISISLSDLAEEIYRFGQYLKQNFSYSELQEEGADFAGTDCRLRVHEGSWELLTGDPQYDLDHRGFWGCSSIPRGCNRRQSKEIAKELINDLS